MLVQPSPVGGIPQFRTLPQKEPKLRIVPAEMSARGKRIIEANGGVKPETW